MEWYAYYYNSNKRKIELYNIFNHGIFKTNIKALISEYKSNKITKEEFTKEVRQNLMYYFWSKCEWEVLIKKDTDDNNNTKIYLSPWIGSKNPEEESIDITNDNLIDWISFADKHIKNQTSNNSAKIDVYDQIYYSFNTFIDYLIC